MTRVFLLGIFISLSFFVTQADGVLAAECPASPAGYCNQYPDRSSPSSLCQRGYTESNEFTCPGSFDSVCCVSDTSTSANRCTGSSTSFMPCTTPSGERGSCGESGLTCAPFDDNADDNGLGEITGETSGGGIGTACRASNAFNSRGVCQPSNYTGDCRYALTASNNCSGSLLCCINDNGESNNTNGGAVSTSKAGCPQGFQGRGSVCLPTGTGLSSIPIALLLRNIMNWLLLIFGSLAIMAFVISGIQYLLAAGDEGRMETGKRNMQFSILGVIIALAGLVIVKAIDMALLGSSFF